MPALAAWLAIVRYKRVSASSDCLLGLSPCLYPLRKMHPLLRVMH